VANTARGTVVVEWPHYWQGYWMIEALTIRMDPSKCSILVDLRLQRCSLPPRYSTFVWIGSGLSFADLVWIRSRPWKEFDPKNPPSFLQTVVKTNDDKPDVYLEPTE
jgi:hypothetical protein